MSYTYAPDVVEELKKHAEPFVDTDPNAVVRRLLEQVAPSGRRTRRARDHKRAPVGSLLPEMAYELPILEVLVEEGGTAHAHTVIDRVGEKLEKRLTDRDKQLLPSGGIRWQKRVQFARLRLAERGLLRRDSGRGIWAITDTGRRHLADTP